MTMTLVEKQWHFLRMTNQLATFAAQRGWMLTFGEAHRPGWLAKQYAKLGIGIENSRHTDRLAIDFNLFINGVYQTKTEAYLPLGQFWESLGGRWGGRFKRKDGNHFEAPL